MGLGLDESRFKEYEMAKSGLLMSSLKRVLWQRAKSGGWTLCIGAGTSYPMFPNWYDLVSGLVARDIGRDKAKDIMPNLGKGFGLDALVQAARDRLSLSPDEFAVLLSDELYSNVKRGLTNPEWKTFRRGLASFHPGDMTPPMWKKFETTMMSHFPDVSAVELANVVVDSEAAGSGPAAILSFNAEPLLYALINARASARAPHSPKATLDRITRSLSNRSSGRIPFVFCHGLLPIEGHPSSDWHSIDKLVFSEADYLQVANSGFTWQSSTFFDACMSRSVVFIGLSFSDANLRRWLGIMHQNRLRELESIGHTSVVSAPHYWFRTFPRTSEEKAWIEAAVAHLGVRLVWLKNWAEAGVALRSMLGL
jgi:hypothetical protein